MIVLILSYLADSVTVTRLDTTRDVALGLGSQHEQTKAACQGGTGTNSPSSIINPWIVQRPGVRPHTCCRRPYPVTSKHFGLLDVKTEVAWCLWDALCMLCMDAKQSLLLSHESVVMSSSCYHSPCTPVQLTTCNTQSPWSMAHWWTNCWNGARAACFPLVF